MSLIDSTVDDLWKTVYALNPASMCDWIDCFQGTYLERVQQSKLVIKKTLTEKEYQSDPKKNFLLRLMTRGQWSYRNSYRSYRRRVELARLFLQVMVKTSNWDGFIVITLQLVYSETSDTYLGLLLRELLTTDNWTESITNEKTIPLHEAARLEDVEQVRQLINKGEAIQINEQGFTPLHFAAMAINPNVEIAKLLINAVNGSNHFLNKQTVDELGKNTALHIAAANVNVTEDFIQQFIEADSLCRNSMKDTVFHVAAKSRNQEAIIYLLNTFAPTNKGWDIDKVEEGKGFQ